MAELLIKAIDSIHSDPIKDARGSYKRGDVVVVMPNDHLWGREEHPNTTTYSPARFFILKIPEMSVEQMNKYIQVQQDDTGLFDPDGHRVFKIIRRRKFRVHVDALSVSDLKNIEQHGELVKPWAGVRTFVRDKVSGISE